MVQPPLKSILRDTSFGKPPASVTDDESTIISMLLPPFMKGSPPPRRSASPVKVTSFDERVDSDEREIPSSDDKIDMSFDLDGKDEVSMIVSFEDQRVAPPNPKDLAEQQELADQIDTESVESGGFIGFLGDHFNSGIDHLKKGVDGLKEKVQTMVPEPAPTPEPTPEADEFRDFLDDESEESGGFIGFLGEQFTGAYHAVSGKVGDAKKSVDKIVGKEIATDEAADNPQEELIKDYEEKLNELVYLTKELNEKKMTKKAVDRVKEINTIKAALEQSKSNEVPIKEEVKKRMQKSMALVEKALEKQQKLDEDFNKRLEHAKHSEEYFSPRPVLDESEKLVLPPPLQAGMKLEYDSAYQTIQMQTKDDESEEEQSIVEPVCIRRPGLRKPPPKVSFVTRVCDAFSGEKLPRKRKVKNAVEKAWDEIVELAEDLQYTFEMENDDDSVASSRASTAMASRRSRRSARSARSKKSVVSQPTE